MSLMLWKCLFLRSSVILSFSLLCNQTTSMSLKNCLSKDVYQLHKKLYIYQNSLLSWKIILQIRFLINSDIWKLFTHQQKDSYNLLCGMHVNISHRIQVIGQRIKRANNQRRPTQFQGFIICPIPAITYLQWMDEWSFCRPAGSIYSTGAAAFTTLTIILEQPHGIDRPCRICHDLRIINSIH